MEMRQEQNTDMVLEQHQDLLVELRDDLDQLSVFIKGNGDPTKGLLWLAADLSRLIAAQSVLTTTHQKELAEHIKSGGHIDQRATGVWTRLAYDVAKQAITMVVGAAFVLLLLGFRVWTTTPR